MEQNTQKGTYFTLLEATLIKKNLVLDDLIKFSQKQTQIIMETNIEDDSFNQIIDEKEKRINSLLQLDEGFESLYQHVQQELLLNPDHYKDNITRMKELITSITEKSINLQVIEKQNKSKLDNYLLLKRKEIKNYKMSSSAASNYYKNSANHSQGQSYFLDKKN